MFSTSLTAGTCELVVIDTADGDDTLEEKTREVADILGLPNGYPSYRCLSPSLALIPSLSC